LTAPAASSPIGQHTLTTAPSAPQERTSAMADVMYAECHLKLAISGHLKGDVVTPQA
jgi:hypothetical protein